MAFLWTELCRVPTFLPEALNNPSPSDNRPGSGCSPCVRVRENVIISSIFTCTGLLLPATVPRAKQPSLQLHIGSFIYPFTTFCSFIVPLWNLPIYPFIYFFTTFFPSSFLYRICPFIHSSIHLYHICSFIILCQISVNPSIVPSTQLSLLPSFHLFTPTHSFHESIHLFLYPSIHYPSIQSSIHNPFILSCIYQPLFSLLPSINPSIYPLVVPSISPHLI